MAVESTAVHIVNKYLSEAYTRQASDVHIEPTEQGSLIRLRIDGILVETGRYEKGLHEGVVARLKVLGSLRTDIRFLPQDGRFKIEILGKLIDARLSIIPTYYGEKCVIRLLLQGQKTISLQDLGYQDKNKRIIEEALSLPQGMFLVVGPTGSGKTTTLYSILHHISSSEISTVTLEDPIEYSVKGITQIPVHGKGGFTFATALRSVVRQDPDVIMVGEIRDSETAKIATHIALTGHMLFSTLHTNDALTALPRLIDMGVEPFLLASTLRLVISQRLVRKLCKDCSKEKATTNQEKTLFERLKETIAIPQSLRTAHGCKECHNTGFSGRISINEVLAITPEIQTHLTERKSTVEIAKQIQNFSPISADGLEKVAAGITSLSEVLSAIEMAL